MVLNVSAPLGGPESFGTSARDSVNISKLVIPARLPLEPLGLMNSSKAFIAPGLRAKSLAFKMWVVDCQPGPNNCLATIRIIAVLPTPAGPDKSKWGGLSLVDAVANVSLMELVVSKCSNLVGAFDCNHDVIVRQN